MCHWVMKSSVRNTLHMGVCKPEQWRYLLTHTIGGFHGKITEVKENTVMVSLAPEIVVEIEKSALVQNASQVGGQN